MIALLLTLWTAQAQEPDALERAYQKEYAYLVAEKDALAKRLVGFEAEAAERTEAAEARLGALQGQLLTLQRAADGREDDLVAAERAGTGASDGRDVLEATLAQAGETLALTDPTLEAVTTAAVARFRDGGRTRVSPGAFFLPDGAQVDGDIVRIGEIAAYGVGGGAAGALVPVGEGRLQLSDEGADVARALIAGERPGQARLFLFESPDKRIEEAKAKTLMDTLRAGGPIGAVIVALGAVLALLALARTAILGLATRGSGAAAAVIQAVREGRVADARQAVDRVAGPMGRILRVPLDQPGADAEGLETLTAHALAQEEARIDRFGTAILVIAAVSPLLGLLGTVSGMISTFDVITQYGTGDPKLLSGGISEALITTELGLIVAIPGVLLGNLLNSRAKGLLDRLEQSAALLVHHTARAEPDQQDDEPLRLADRKHA